LLTSQDVNRVVAKVELARPGKPTDLYVKLRLPSRSTLQSVTVNSRPGTIGGPHNDTVIIKTGTEKVFEVVGLLG